MDAETHEQLGVLIDKISVSQGDDGKTSWGEIRKVMDFYAKRFRARMDAEHSD